MPKLMDVLNPDGSFRTEAKQINRIQIKTTKQADNATITLKKGTKPVFWAAPNLAMFDPTYITIDVHANSARDALNDVDDLLEDVCDSLAFRIQSQIFIIQLEVINITPPAKVGDIREVLYYSAPLGYSHAKMAAHVPIGSIVGEPFPVLKVDFSAISGKGTPKEKGRDKALMRWYHKSLATRVSADQLLFLMACLEILAKTYDKKVMAPYKTICQHEIANCPTCKKSLMKEVNGATLKKLLVELGASEEDANLIWKLRQMVHGEILMDRPSTERLPDACRALNVAVTRGIKLRFGMSETDFPHVTNNPLIIDSALHMVISRPLTLEDVE